MLDSHFGTMTEKTKAFFQQQFEDSENRKCADTGEANPQWASISYGCYISMGSSGKHRGLGVHISFVRSLTMDNWKPAQLNMMALGGNRRLKEFFEEHGIPAHMPIVEKYNTRAAKWYRDNLRALADGKAPPPLLPKGTGHLPAPQASSIMQVPTPLGVDAGNAAATRTLIGPNAKDRVEVGTVLVARCPMGHKLELVAAQAGTCNGCRVRILDGDPVMDCRKCNWYLCKTCHPLDATSASKIKELSPELVTTRTGQDLWHSMVACSGGTCRACEKRTSSDAQVMGACNNCQRLGSSSSSGDCNAEAKPAPMCPAGHKLQPWIAPQGICDGCARVQSGTQVMDCRRCDWYLCMVCCPSPRTTANADFWSLPRKALDAAAQDLQEVAKGFRNLADTTTKDMHSMANSIHELVSASVGSRTDADRLSL